MLQWILQHKNCNRPGLKVETVLQGEAGVRPADDHLYKGAASK